MFLPAEGRVGSRGERLLAQLLARGIQRNWSMQISWGGCSEQALQVNLPCARIQQVGSAHYVGHALVTIVYDNGELVGEEAVGAQDHKIAAVILHILASGDLVRQNR